MLGKFLASLTLFAVMLLPTAGFCLIHVPAHFADAALRMMLAGYLGILLFGGSLLALGCLHLVAHGESDHRRRAYIRRVSCFSGCSISARVTPAALLARCCTILSVISHYEDFTQGIIDTSGLIYYLSFIILFIFLTVRSVDSMRWRRA